MDSFLYNAMAIFVASLQFFMVVIILILTPSQKGSLGKF